MCHQTPTCVLSTWTNTPEVMHTAYPQSQNHLLSPKPSLPSGQSRKITPRHTRTHSPETWINKHTVQSHHLHREQTAGVFSRAPPGVFQSELFSQASVLTFNTTEHISRPTQAAFEGLASFRGRRGVMPRRPGTVRRGGDCRLGGS